MRFPDARINGDGPLPTSLSGPAGINGDADGRYNASNDLLSGITPYAGPKTGRVGSDRNYQQIPHRVQYAVPKLYLPRPNGTSQIEVSHAVDNGDLALVVRHGQRLLGPYFNPHDPMRKPTPVICNIVTANYLLAGIQQYMLGRIDKLAGKVGAPPPTRVSDHDMDNQWWKLMQDWRISAEFQGLEEAL
jgi:hypothetical protein